MKYGLGMIRKMSKKILTTEFEYGIMYLKVEVDIWEVWYDCIKYT